jgi:hydroxymethylglutaryl-CoA lyase
MTGNEALHREACRMSQMVTIVETPRDAFQGLSKFIPTEEKIRYIESILDAGVKHVDLGSFVSPKAVPQMSDSDKVVQHFSNLRDLERIAIVVNGQGIKRAIDVGGLDALGFPFSLSRTFQVQNTKVSTAETWPLVEQIIADTEHHDMSFILYISMAFGNPYGELWDEEVLFRFIRSLSGMGVRHISLADTVAVAKPEQVARIFKRARDEFAHIEFSAHFHGRPTDWFECIDAALGAGCRRFDGACGGLGGCPFAQDELVANVPTDLLVKRLEAAGFQTGVDLQKIGSCAAMAQDYQRKFGM